VRPRRESGARPRRKRSVRSTLFFSYLLLILISGSFFTVFSYFYTANVLRRRAIESLQELSVSVTGALDTELQKMNNVSINVTFSGLFKQLVVTHLGFPLEPRTQQERSLKYLNSAELVEVMEAIIGPFKPVPQINYYDLRGEMIGAGVYSQSAPLLVYNVPWLTHIELATGIKRFSRPHEDPLVEKVFPLYENQKYISLYRAFFDEYRQPLGVVEVKQFTDTIFRNMVTQTSRVLVFGEDGTVLFPFDEGEASESYRSVADARDGEILTLVDPANGRSRIATVRSSVQAPWRVVVSQEERSLLKPVRDFTRLISSFSVLLFLAAGLIASRLSRRLTTPLRAMHGAISALDWDAVAAGTGAGVASDLNELEELQLAFQKMQGKLKQSMDEVLEARTHEIQATMLALQSQMDPHFVYNMLTTIGIMAEEGMVEEIARSVEHLTHLLRYISSGKSSVVTIEDELEYARRYLACMKVRFRDKLSFDIQVPEELRRISVPKLIIQPIIENTMKYGTSGAPPWRVTIEGEGRDGHWRVRVRDNGPGFEAARLTRLCEEIERRMSLRPDPSLEISGMGLLNIASRLRLFYGDEAVYRLGNNETGGASVVIGGTRQPRAQV
jgi:two-component system sensor histidine kinase YesM